MLKFFALHGETEIPKPLIWKKTPDLEGRILAAFSNYVVGQPVCSEATYDERKRQSE